MYKLIIIFIIAGCQTELATPSCDFIEATRTGERVAIRINSDEPRFAMCREYESGTVCTNISSNFYDCISIRADRGDVVRFISESSECEIIIK